MPTVRKTKKKMSPNNYLPKENEKKLTTEDIIIEGDDLDYWKEHSEYINAAYRWYHDTTKDTKLILKYTDYPDFDTDDWIFLRYYLHKRKLEYTNTKKGRIIFNLKNYTNEQARNIIDFILYRENNNNSENNNNRENNNMRRYRNLRVNRDELDAREEEEIREEMEREERENSLKRMTRRLRKQNYRLQSPNNNGLPYGKRMSRSKKEKEHLRKYYNEQLKKFKLLSKK